MKTLPLSKDYEFELGVMERDTAGSAVAVTGITGWTAWVSLTVGGTAVHASLTEVMTERAGAPGCYTCVFDVAALEAYLAAYAGEYVYIVVFLNSVVQSESFPRLVQRYALTEAS